MCVHYWVIEPPNGPISKGVCKNCGTEKAFPNWINAQPFKTDNLIVPLRDDFESIIGKLVDGSMEALHGKAIY